MSIRPITSRRSAMLLAPLATAALLLTACSNPSAAPEPGSEDAPLKVLIISGETGALSVNSEAMRLGVDAAVASLNEAGGVLGREIEVATLDDQSDPTRAVTLLQEYVADHGKPDFVAAGQTSNEALALAPLLTRDQIIGMASVSSPALDNPAEYPYFFSTAVKQADVTAAAAAFLADQGDVEKVGLVITNDALRDAVEPALQAALDEVGIELSVHAFDPEAIDISSAFTEARAAGADWIYADAIGTVVPRLFEGRVKAGAETIPTVGGSGIAVSPFTDFTTEQQRENFYPVLYPLTHYIAPEDRSDALNDFISRLGDLSELPVTINTHAYGWDQIMIWANAVEQAGTADSDAVRDALQALELSGADAADQPWVLWRNLFSEDSHFPQVTAEEFAISQVTGERKDTMLVLKED
ncbi:ABC transporter substrate-binding protein [Microbacterium sp.]|uniref:ABC transporter substrate-binding protein n=1 Tax=Microbacterium sp. TaxID=51671 RepID=UPI002D15A7B9|nr:ABC transporter substrate-binding protein [Microbacterium sp.]HWL77678.1 ABC transporter substrate-binding protein [Microbacterium sp.]